MTVNLTKFSTNVNNIQGLSDRPNTIDGLTSSELKAKFDKAGADIKTYLNGTLTVETEQIFNNILNSVEQLENQLEMQKNQLFPVGKIEMFYDNDDHSNYLGFTWTRVLIGKMPIGLNLEDTDFNEIGKTGGEKTHQLTNSELPKLSGSAIFHGAGSFTVLHTATGIFTGTGKRNRYHKNDPDNGAGSYDSLNINFGGDQAHNNMSPYEVVAFWKRVS